MIESINIGTFIFETFNLIVGFFSKLYEMLSISIKVPELLKTILNDILSLTFPNIVIPETISILTLLSVAGVPVALAIGIYFILKGPV